jgi:general secretion pathway protein N
MNDGTALMRSLVLWGIAFAIVLAALAYETDWGRDIDRDAAAPRPAPPAPVTVSLLPEYKIAGGVDARKETVDRVLFNPTRRPAPPAPQTAGGAAGSMVKGQYALTGTTVTGNVATAFLREVKGGKSHTVHAGETLNGIVIADVKSDHVRLKQGDEVEDLQLKIASGPKSTVQVAVPAPAVPGQPQPVRQAGAVPAGGSGEAALSGRAARGAAAAQSNVANPNAAPRANGAVSVSEILAERRRAARAAAAAANQGGVQRAQ